MKIVATIEARMGSSRLPNKVLMDLGGFKSLECQIRRLRQSRLIDEIVLATTVEHSDDALEDFAKSIEVKYFRGSEEDILSRILGASTSVDGDLQVQITGDCPLIDPEIVDQVIQTYIDSNGKYDFVSNELERSFPIGLDCRVFPVKILKEVDEVCTDPIHRVHGSTYIYMGPGKEKYNSVNIKAPELLNHPSWRWTLDTPEDLKFFQALFKHYGKGIIDIRSNELATWLLQNPDIIKINSHVRQKEISEG